MTIPCRDSHNRPDPPIPSTVIFELDTQTYWVNINGRSDGWRLCDEHGRRLEEGDGRMSEDLAAWLLEQIAEDERVAGDLAADGWPKHDGRVLSMERAMKVPWPDRWHPGLILRECDAKRQVVNLSAWHLEAWRSQQSNPEGVQFIDVEARGRHSELTLKLLSLPYADRPGYREEWRP